MDPARQKIVQYLNEAHATEMALVRVLQSQIAMTPRGAYRNGLEKHLGETQDHARRVQERLGQLGEGGDGGSPVQFLTGIAEALVGQAVALAKTPLDIVRGTGGEEKVLKNARDAAATEALEIATYTSIERIAREAGDETTAKLAADILRDEQKMLDLVLREIPKLTDAVFRAEVKGSPSFDASKTAAAESARKAGRTAKKTAKRTARQTASKAEDRAARITREGATTSQPWAGYDDQTVDEIQKRLTRSSESTVQRVRTYERANKDRKTIIEATERQTSNA